MPYYIPHTLTQIHTHTQRNIVTKRYETNIVKYKPVLLLSFLKCNSYVCQSLSNTFYFVAAIGIFLMDCIVWRDTNPDVDWCCCCSRLSLSLSLDLVETTALPTVGICITRFIGTVHIIRIIIVIVWIIIVWIIIIRIFIVRIIIVRIILIVIFINITRRQSPKKNL